MSRHDAPVGVTAGASLQASGIIRRFRMRSSGRGTDITALDGVDLSVRSGEAVGLVGESGSGKTTLGRILTGLDGPTAGTVLLDGEPVETADGPRFRQQRRRLQYVFQDPLSALNPRLPIDRQVAEGLVVHRGLPLRDAIEQACTFLASAGLDRDAARRYPHQISGGQRQRAVIARSLVLRPDFVVLDEPVSALDLSVQAQILGLIAELRSSLGLGMVFISHDLRVVRYACDRMAVLHRGQVVEAGDADTVYHAPQHPYTRSLIAAIPRLPAAGNNAWQDGAAR